MIPKSVSLGHISPLNKCTHTNVHRFFPPACPILHVPNCAFSYGPYFSEKHPFHQVIQIRKLGATLDSSFFLIK